jgi:S-formylglutathione hydrolase FrmB
MQILSDEFNGPRRADGLLVLLPPAGATATDFQTHGFVSDVRRLGLPVDIVLVQPTYQQVMQQTLTAALHENVVGPAKTKGYSRTWMVGISLGGFNALHYAVAHAASLAGVLLIAPYPGTGDVLAEMTDAGGPVRWSQNAALLLEDERVWWKWLCEQSASGAWETKIFMSTGSNDRFSRGQRMLAPLLVPENVRFVPGEHDWPTWELLWRDWLMRGHLSSSMLPEHEER